MCGTDTEIDDIDTEIDDIDTEIDEIDTERDEIDTEIDEINTEIDAIAVLLFNFVTIQFCKLWSNNLAMLCHFRNFYNCNHLALDTNCKLMIINF